MVIFPHSAYPIKAPVKNPLVRNAGIEDHRHCTVAMPIAAGRGSRERWRVFDPISIHQIFVFEEVFTDVLRSLVRIIRICGPRAIIISGRLPSVALRTW